HVDRQRTHGRVAQDVAAVPDCAFQPIADPPVVDLRSRRIVDGQHRAAVAFGDDPALAVRVESDPRHDPARPRGLVAALERIADAAGREEHRHGEPLGIDAVAGDLPPLAAYGVVGRAAADDRATIADDAPQPFDDL